MLSYNANHQMLNRESDIFTISTDLVEAVNKARFERFEKILEKVVKTYELAMIERFQAKDETPEKAPKGTPHGDFTLLKEQYIDTVGGWYMDNHGVNNESTLQDMLTILTVRKDILTFRNIDDSVDLLEYRS